MTRQKTANDRFADRLDSILAQQAKDRGLTPMPLELDALLRRVRDGGWSGEYLGEALLSAYWTDRPFNFSLGKMHRLDAEGFRLFHQILHIRMIPNWRDDVLWELAQEIKTLLAKENPHVSSTSK